MYKIEVDDVENKLLRIKNSKFTFFMMFLSGMMLVVGCFEYGIEIALYLSFTVLFLISFINFYFIIPLLSKIELLEEDIIRLREKVGVDDQKHL